MAADAGMADRAQRDAMGTIGVHEIDARILSRMIDAHRITYLFLFFEG